MNKVLPQGTRVKFFHGLVMEGEGIICGIAIASMPVIGYCYIIQPDKSLFGLEHSHFVLFESQFEVLP